MAAFGGLIRSTIVVLLAMAMGLLIVLAVRSLVAPAPDDTSAGSAPEDSAPGNSAPAGPVTTVVFGSGQSVGSVGCYRPAGADGEPFYVEVLEPGSDVAVLAIGVVLIESDGARQRRTVQLEAVTAGEPVQAPVADSADPSRFVACTVTAVQRDQQVILTGN